MTPADFESWLLAADRRPLVMGILNVTPDSFSDGGRFASVDDAVARAQAMIEQGVDLIDVGGESTRPGSLPVEPAEQIRRVVPVIETLRASGVMISIDTTRADVGAAAIDAGAGLLNDVSGGTFDPAMMPLAAKRAVPIVLMHMLGTPLTMQDAPHYADVVSEVRTHLQSRASAAIDAGVPRHRVLLDVGIGFGKSLEHNLALLRHYDAFAALGHATLLGTSRKGFIGKLSGVQQPEDRVFGSVATAVWGVTHGASIVRVHDVAATVQALRVIDAIRR